MRAFGQPAPLKRLATCLAAACLLLLVAAVPGHAERRVALVIGNADYESVPKLANPGNDAKSIASSLKAVGFDSVLVRQDLTYSNFIATLREFAQEAEKSDWAVVYYSGHGIEVGGVNYMLPIDARLKTDRDVELEAIDLNKVVTAVEAARKLRLVILDACRDNPFAAQMKRSVATRSVGRGLGQVEPEAGTLVVYSAKHGQVALDGDGANSPFATALVGRIQTPNLEVRRLFDFVRDDVVEQTRRQQQPFSYGSLPGREDYYFLSSATGALPPSAPPLPSVSPVVPKPAPAIDPKELASAVQSELGRVGCSAGAADGVWGAASQAAVQRLNRATAMRFDAATPTPELLSFLKGRPARTCPPAVVTVPPPPTAKPPEPRADPGAVQELEKRAKQLQDSLKALEKL